MTGTARREGDLRNYILVTAAYWADTLADGASRILVLFFFYQLGYSALEVATLFLFGLLAIPDERYSLNILHGGLL